MELSPTAFEPTSLINVYLIQIRNQWASGRALEDKFKGFWFKSTGVQNLLRFL